MQSPKTFALSASPVQVVLPNRRRSNSAIIAWAALVQPGSPAPRTPPAHTRRRRGSSSCSRSVSVSRRPSVSSGTASYLIVNTPTTPSTTGKPVNLTDLGYSSVFVHFPVTPSTPSPFLQKQKQANATAYAHIPIPPIPVSPTKSTTKAPKLRHFRSLSALTRGRSKSVSSATKAAEPVPPMPTPTPKSASRAQFFAVSIAKRKKAQYKYVRPAPLASELALMQFADGGKLEAHVQRVMAHQAKMAGPSAGVGDVFRDGEGGLWWDEDEEWEYAHLLGGEERICAEAGEWVQFDGEAGKEEDSKEAEERRGSVSTQDSDLEPRFLVQAEDDEMAGFIPLVMRRPGASVLALPARPRRAAKHLNKPVFVLDAAFTSETPIVSSKPAKTKTARRRPAPLKLGRINSNAAPAPKTADLTSGRNAFLAASFEPCAPTVAVAALAPPATPLSPRSPVIAKNKPSMLNMRGLFRRRE